jgi:O-antigen ligase
MGEALVVLWMISAFRVNDLLPVLTPQISMGLMVVAFFAIVITRPRGSTSQARISIAVLLWLGLWVMSMTWSWNFWVWFADARNSIGLIIIGMLIAGVVEVDRIKRGLCTSIYVILPITVLFSLAGGVDEGGAWHGSFVHKNIMGGFMAIAILILVHLEDRFIWKAGAITVAMGLAVMSQSATALLMIGAAGATTVILRRVASLPHRQATAYFFSVTTLVLLVLTALAIQYATVVTGLGRDGSLTGRTDIWPSTWDMIQVRPWIGWGPGVWIQQNADPARYIGSQTGFNVGHSHNTFLEVLLLWGIVGLTLYLGMLVALARSAWRLVRIQLHWAALSLGFLSVLLVQSISEPALFGWVGMVAMLHVLMQRLWDEHRRATPTTAVDDLDMDRLVR